MIETQPQNPQPIPATEPAITPLVTLSDAAAAKLSELTKEEADPNVGLRVYVYSGGCSGYRYGMMLEDQPSPATPASAVTSVKRPSPSLR